MKVYHLRPIWRELGVPRRLVCCLPWLLGVALLAACGTPYRHFSPVFDASPSSRTILTAHGSLRASFELLSALTRAHHAADFATTRWHLMQALDAIDPNSEHILLSAARLAYAAQRPQDALALFDVALAQGHQSAALYQTHALGLVEAKDFPGARELAFDGLDLFPDDADLLAAADRAIDDDPLLIPKKVRSIGANDADSLKALGGGSTVTLKMVINGKNAAAIKPDQDLGQSMYRSEIAYYRLCVLLRCSFRVPYNEEVRFSRSDFDSLYGRVDTPKQRGYRSMFSHLSWRKQDGQEWLYATAKEWVPNFVGFPIEATSAWTHLLAAGNSKGFDEPAAGWLSKLAAAAGERGYRDHARRVEFVGELSVGHILRQISDVLATDFLSNNWDRFAGSPELYGANCNIEEGGLVAIDNGAAFPPWNTDRVVRRLKLTQKFSKTFVKALRRMEYDKSLQRLFPEPTKDERKRFDFFWERRRELLDGIDQLIEKHGEEKVLAF